MHHVSSQEEGPIVTGNAATIELISNHIEKYIGPIATVFHQKVSHYVHVDVYVVAPTEKRNYYTLVTSGMSDIPMTVPDGVKASAYAELILCLPPDWPFITTECAECTENGTTPHTILALQSDADYWPVGLLMDLACAPHEYKTFFMTGHTFAYGVNEKLTPEAQFTGALFVPPRTLTEKFVTLVVSRSKKITFLAVMPLYEEELECKRAEGLSALFPGMEAQNASEILNTERPNFLTDQLDSEHWLFEDIRTHGVSEGETIRPEHCILARNVKTLHLVANDLASLTTDSPRIQKSGTFFRPYYVLEIDIPCVFEEKALRDLSKKVRELAEKHGANHDGWGLDLRKYRGDKDREVVPMDSNPLK
jgi:hypothetical protein